MQRESYRKIYRGRGTHSVRCKCPLCERYHQVVMIPPDPPIVPRVFCQLCRKKSVDPWEWDFIATGTHMVGGIPCRGRVPRLPKGP